MKYYFIEELEHEIGFDLNEYQKAAINVILNDLPIKPGDIIKHEGSLDDRIKLSVQKKIGNEELPLLISFYNDGTVLMHLKSEDGGLYKAVGFEDDISYSYYDKEAFDTVNGLVKEYAEKIEQNGYPISTNEIPNIELPQFSRYASKFGISPDYECDYIMGVHDSIPNVIEGIEDAKFEAKNR